MSAFNEQKTESGMMDEIAMAQIRSALVEAFSGAAELQALSAKTAYTPAEVSRLFGVSVSWLEKLRADNRGPAYVSLGPKKILYTKKAIEQWMDVQTVTPRSI